MAKFQRLEYQSAQRLLGELPDDIFIKIARIVFQMDWEDVASFNRSIPKAKLMLLRSRVPEYSNERNLNVMALALKCREEGNTFIDERLIRNYMYRWNICDAVIEYITRVGRQDGSLGYIITTDDKKNEETGETITTLYSMVHKTQSHIATKQVRLRTFHHASNFSLLHAGETPCKERWWKRLWHESKNIQYFRGHPGVMYKMWVASSKSTQFYERKAENEEVACVRAVAQNGTTYYEGRANEERICKFVAASDGTTYMYEGPKMKECKVARLTKDGSVEEWTGSFSNERLATWTTKDGMRFEYARSAYDNRPRLTTVSAPNGDIYDMEGMYPERVVRVFRREGRVMEEYQGTSGKEVMVSRINLKDNSYLPMTGVKTLIRPFKKIRPPD